MIHTNLTLQMNGDVDSGTLWKQGHGQSGLRVLRFPGSDVWVSCRHGQIFMAAQVWHKMSQTLVWGILLNSWHGRNNWGLAHLGCWCCRCSRCGLHMLCRFWQCRLCHWEVVSGWSLWCGTCATWDNVDYFDTVFMKVSPHVVLCGTIAGAYLIAVPW